MGNSEWTFTIAALALTYNRRARLNDGFDERLENFNALKQRRRGRRICRDECLCFKGAKEVLRMGNVTDTVYLCVFLLRRALSGGEVRQIGHEPCDEAFEEGHHEHQLHPRQSCDERSDRKSVV